MIPLTKLSRRARDILVELKPIRGDWENEKFTKLYAEFLKETNFEFADLGFDGFQVASKNYERKSGFKAETIYDLETKVMHRNARDMKIMGDE